MYAITMMDCTVRCASIFTIIFFSKQKTAYEMRISDWSSDVCSSDLAFGQPDRRALAEARQRRDEQALLPERRPVALRILEQFVRLRNPERAAPALQPVVENDPRDLSALARPGAVAEKPAAPEPDGRLIVVARRADHIPGLVNCPGARQVPAMRLPGINDRLQLGVGQ